MSETRPVIVFSLLTEDSPQALPLGAACVVSSIKSRPFFCGWSVLLKDETLEDALYVGVDQQSSGKRIASILAAQNPCAVCFSVYVWNRIYLECAATELVHLIPDCVIVAGGPEVTAHPDDFPTFMYTVAGEGETAVPELLEAVLSQNVHLGEDPHIQGVYTAGGKMILHRAVPADPQSLVSPYLDGTLNPTDYGGALWELARGCPFSCSYCYESKGEKIVRRFPMDRLRSELQLFVRSGIAQIFVLDPTYNADRQRAVEILSMIKKMAPDIYFNFEVRAEFLDRQLAQLFAAISCSLQIGLQSADSKVLSLVNRTFDRKEFVKKIGLLNSEGVIFGFDLIYGLPSDTLSGFLASIDFAINLYPNHLDLFRLSVLPGTTLAENAASYGLTWDNKAPYLVQSSPSFSAADLDMAEAIARSCTMFYSCGRAVSWFISVLKPLKMQPSAFFSEFAAFLRKRCPEALHFDAACKSHREVEQLQLAFLRIRYTAKHLMPFWDAVQDIVTLNGAFCRALAEEETTILHLHWHPEDLLGADVCNIAVFVQDVCREQNSVRVFPTQNGPDFRIL